MKIFNEGFLETFLHEDGAFVRPRCQVHLHSLVNPTRRVVTPRLHKRPGTTSESTEEDRTCMSAQRSRPSNKSFGHQIAIQSSKANRSAAKVDLKHRSSRLIAIIKMPNRISSFKAPGTTANLQKCAHEN